jgi:hypothetical protein
MFGQPAICLTAFTKIKFFPVSSSERPTCPTCQHRMGLARISLGKTGFEQRTFECATCHRIEKVSIPVDPFKTNAVGWLASELRPLR